jgi:hypothetical protein
VRAWNGLVSINGRAWKRLRAWSWRKSINGRALGARERRRESRFPISNFKSKSSVAAPDAVVVEVSDVPCTKGRSSKGELQQKRFM